MWPRVLRLLATAGLLLAGGCGSPAGSPDPTPSLSEPAPTQTPGRQAASSVAYVIDDDLFSYDVAGDQTKQLTSDGAESREVSPRFTDSGTIAYAAGRSIFEIDVATAQSRRIRRVPGEVRLIDWNPDRTGLVLLFQTNELDAGLTLRLEAFGEGQSHDIRRFEPWLGRGGHEDDEVAVRWSPDGTKLLVVLTPLDTISDETMFIVDIDGKDVVEPRFGTMARWAADSTTVYYRDLGAPRRWHVLDIATDSVQPLAMTRSTVQPALSPEGKFLAHGEASGDLTIYLFDLATGMERSITSGYLGPLWLDGETLAATDVRACVAGGNCEGAWVYEGPAVKIATEDGAIEPLALPSTVHQAEPYPAFSHPARN